MSWTAQKRPAPKEENSMNLIPFLAGILLLAAAILSALDCKYMVSQKYRNAPFRKDMQQGSVMPYAVMGLDGIVVGLIGSNGMSIFFWAAALVIFLAGLLLLRRNWKKYLG